MRNQHLDFIRGCAMMMVLFRHSNISNRIFQIGWMSVDVFFVLSGFLISSLLIKEYKKRREVDIKRFLIRRMFKIFPPFYFFLFSSCILNYYFGHHDIPIKNILIEIFYLQSYFSTNNFHTWSLAVEEHFYLIYTMLFYQTVKLSVVHKIKPTIFILCVALVATFSLRLIHSYPHKDDYFFSFTYTHLRCDGVIIGVLLAYLTEYTTFLTVVENNKTKVAILAACLIFPGFLFHGGSFFMNTIGLTLSNISFGLACSLAIVLSPFTNLQKIQYLPYRTICFIGIHSYSIYLWHLTISHYVSELHPNKYIVFTTYILLSLLMGITLSYLIEQPFQKLKEKLSFSKKLSY